MGWWLQVSWLTGTPGPDRARRRQGGVKHAWSMRGRTRPSTLNAFPRGAHTWTLPSSCISRRRVAKWMAQDSFSRVFTRPTTSSLERVSISSGTSKIFRAVPRPSRDSFPWSLHFSQDTQSRTRDTFWSLTGETESHNIVQRSMRTRAKGQGDKGQGDKGRGTREKGNTSKLGHTPETPP